MAETVDQAREALRAALADSVRAVDPDHPGRIVTDYVFAVEMIGDDPGMEHYAYDGTGSQAMNVGLAGMLHDVMSEDDDG